MAAAVSKRTPRYLESAFADYGEQRHQRTARCQVLARVYGGFYHAEHVTRELANPFLASRA